MTRGPCQATCLNGQACSHRVQEGRSYCGKHINAQRRAEAQRAREEVARAVTEGVAAHTRERRTLSSVALPLTSSEKNVKVECEECDNTCPICMDEIVGEKVICSNGHAVCEKHIIQSITANKGLNDSVLKCSVCRAPILTSQVSYACNALLDIVCNKSRGWNISDWNMMKDSVKNSERSKV